MQASKPFKVLGWIGLIGTLPLLVAACSAYVDSRVENALLESLPKVVGPAENYEVRVRGSNGDATHFETMRVVGHRVARDNVPVLDQVALDLQGVSINRQEKQLTGVDVANGQVTVLAADLADYLQRQGWMEGATVRFVPPRQIIVTGNPTIAGLALPIARGAEFRGQLVPRGPQLLMTVDYLRLGNAEAPPVLRAIVERTVNPLVDTSAYPLPAQLDDVSASGDQLVIKASGTRAIEVAQGPGR
jgi:LmeA-like phospholipid-binding